MQNYEVHIATYQDAAKPLAQHIPEQSVKVVVRLGGKMPYAGYGVQINKAQSIENSIDKQVQKQLLLNAGLATLPFLREDYIIYPCVVKGRIRSCGTKVFVANDAREWQAAYRKLDHDCYTEPLFEATSEYRLHCTRDEVFFAVKKIKRNPADILINHKNHYNVREFPKPRLWKEIQAECIKAMAALDLDIACFDVMYCSKDDNKHIFTIAEANTNPELLANTFAAYAEMLTKMIKQKVADYKKNEEQDLQKQKEIQNPEKEMLNAEQKCNAIKAIMDNNYAIVDDGGWLHIKL